MNADCSLAPVALFLADHKAETLDTVVKAVQSFAAQYDSDAIRFVLAAGNSGVEAATNQEITKAQTQILILVYSVVAALVFLSFRSFAAVICIMVPLGLTSAPMIFALGTASEVGSSRRALIAPRKVSAP